jgi:hypothetical protein
LDTGITSRIAMLRSQAQDAVEELQEVVDRMRQSGQRRLEQQQQLHRQLQDKEQKCEERVAAWKRAEVGAGALQHSPQLSCQCQGHQIVAQACSVRSPLDTRV